MFSKLTQMLRKKAKMTFWWLNAGINSIRKRSLCSTGDFWVAKKFTVTLYISKKFSDYLNLRKMHLLCFGNLSKRRINCEKLIMRKDKSAFSLKSRQSESFFEMYKAMVNFFATKKSLGIHRERVRMELTPKFSHQNVILAFFRNICVSLRNNSVWRL